MKKILFLNLFISQIELLLEIITLLKTIFFAEQDIIITGNWELKKKKIEIILIKTPVKIAENVIHIDASDNGYFTV